MAMPAFSVTNGKNLPNWLMQTVSHLIVAVLVWALATSRLDAVQEQRLSEAEKEIQSVKETKLSKEQFDEFSRNVLQRLDEIKQDIRDAKQKR